jgi:hypothetical protein
MSDKDFFQMDQEQWFEEYKAASPTSKTPGTLTHPENYFLDVPQ